MRIRNLTVTNFMVLANSQPFEYIITHFISKVSSRPNGHFFVLRHFRFEEIESADNSRTFSAARVFVAQRMGGYRCRRFYRLEARIHWSKNIQPQGERKKEMNQLFRSSSCLHHNNNNNLHFRWLWNNCRRNGSMLNFLNEPKRKTERFYLGTVWSHWGERKKKLPTFIESKKSGARESCSTTSI